MNHETKNERAARYERWLLASLLHWPELIPQITCQRDHFLTSLHSEIFAAIRKLSDAGKVVDILSVCDALEPIGGAYDYLLTLYDWELGVVKENIDTYNHEVRKAFCQRQLVTYAAELVEGSDPSQQLGIIVSMHELVRAEL
jgi:replicative DNA helicase